MDSNKGKASKLSPTTGAVADAAIDVVNHSAPEILLLNDTDGNLLYKDQVQERIQRHDLDGNINQGDPLSQRRSQQKEQQLQHNSDGNLTYQHQAKSNNVHRKAWNTNNNNEDDVNKYNKTACVVHVPGMNTSPTSTRNNESDVNQNLIEQRRHEPADEDDTLQVDGFLPDTANNRYRNNDESIYRVPEENIRRIAHLYASSHDNEEPSATATNMDHQNIDHTTTTSRDSSAQKELATLLSKTRMAKYIILGIILVIVVCIAFVITFFFRNNSQSLSSSGQQQDHNGTVAFLTTEDLMDAVDRWMLGGSNQSDVEVMFGKIQGWDVSRVTNFSFLFSSWRNSHARKFNENISGWNVGSAITMTQMFYGAGLFQSDISQWDLSKVTDMSYFMAEATFFDSDVSLWNTSSLINASNMFYWSSKFMGRGVQYWDVSNVIDFSSMFAWCDNFIGDVSNWNVSKAKDMSFMFERARNFNGNLSLWDISNASNVLSMFQAASSFQGIGLDRWNTNQIESISFMFAGASEFDNNLTNWDISRVTDLTGLFASATAFQGHGIEFWNTSNVKNMTSIFERATSLDADLSRWDVSTVQNAGWMFALALSFQGSGVELWNTSGIESMTCMFCGAELFDANVSLWNVSNVRDMSFTFAGAASFRGEGLEYWDTSYVKSMAAMFASFEYVPMLNGSLYITSPSDLNKTSSFDGNLTNWDVSNVHDFSLMFSGASMFRGIGLQYWNTSMARNMDGMFFQASLFDANLSLWDVSNTNRFIQTFQEASSFQGLGVDQWDTSRIFDLYLMFHTASSFDANLSQWDVSNVINMKGLFSQAVSFTGNGVDIWNTSQALNVAYMFSGADNFDANLSRWDTSQVVHMEGMFSLSSSFRGVGIDTWDTSQTRSMTNMFYGATSFDANLSNWDVSQVKDMAFMFENAVSFAGNGLDRWNISNVNNTAYMFDSAISFQANLSAWDYTNIQNMTDMFHNATSFHGVFWYEP